MDLKRYNKPILVSSIFAIGILTVLSSIALVKIETLYAQEGEMVTTGSFACEPLVFTLGESDEATASASPTASGSGTPRPTATASASPTASPKGGTGGVSPSPSATATAKPSGTATAKPSSTATATPKSDTLPDAGVSAPTVIGAAAGIILLVVASLLAL